MIIIIFDLSDLYLLVLIQFWVHINKSQWIFLQSQKIKTRLENAIFYIFAWFSSNFWQWGERQWWFKTEVMFLNFWLIKSWILRQNRSNDLQSTVAEERARRFWDRLRNIFGGGSDKPCTYTKYVSIVRNVFKLVKVHISYNI